MGPFGRLTFLSLIALGGCSQEQDPLLDPFEPPARASAGIVLRAAGTHLPVLESGLRPRLEARRWMAWVVDSRRYGGWLALAVEGDDQWWEELERSGRLVPTRRPGQYELRLIPAVKGRGLPGAWGRSLRLKRTPIEGGTLLVPSLDLVEALADEWEARGALGGGDEAVWAAAGAGVPLAEVLRSGPLGLWEGASAWFGGAPGREGPSLGPVVSLALDRLAEVAWWRLEAKSGPIEVWGRLRFDGAPDTFWEVLAEALPDPERGRPGSKARLAAALEWLAAEAPEIRLEGALRRAADRLLAWEGPKLEGAAPGPQGTEVLWSLDLKESGPWILALAWGGLRARIEVRAEGSERVVLLLDVSR